MKKPEENPKAFSTYKRKVLNTLKHPILIVVFVTLGIAAIMAYVHIKAGSYSKKRVVEDCRVLIEAEFKERNLPKNSEMTDPTNPENEQIVRDICGEWRLNTIKD